MRWTSTRRWFLSLILGTMVSVVFFVLAERYASPTGYIQRYTMGHPVNYTETWMFFWALAELVFKYLEVRGDQRRLRSSWLPATSGVEPVSTAAALFDRLEQLPIADRQSMIVRRLRDALSDIKESGSAENIDHQLRHLAEKEAESAHDSYGFTRLIIWAIPILGFLGTVIGITIAIANVSPDQLESSLSEVTGGLAVAFDTTGVALIMSMILMFVLFTVERLEQGVLSAVEHRAVKDLAYRFAARSAAPLPILPALEATLSAAGHALISEARKLVAAQAEIWGRSIAHWQEQSMLVTRRQEERFSNLEQRLVESMRDAFATLSVRWSEQNKQTAEVTNRLDKLQAEMKLILETLVNVTREENKLVNSQERLTANIASLTAAETRLTENVALLHQVGNLNEAVHALAAAAHLLTIRQQPAGWSERKAA